MTMHSCNSSTGKVGIAESVSSRFSKRKHLNDTSLVAFIYMYENNILGQNISQITSKHCHLCHFETESYYVVLAKVELWRYTKVS